MKKKLWTSKKLFNTICERLQEKFLLPDILEYHCAGRDDIPIKTISWSTIGVVDFGLNEGIYLDITLEGDCGDDRDKVHLGTFKTLYTDKASFKQMSELNAEFVYELKYFVEDHEEDFNWTGFDVHPYKDDKKMSGYWCPAETKVENLIKNLFERYEYDYIIVTDNGDGRQKKFTRGEQQ